MTVKVKSETKNSDIEKDRTYSTVIVNSVKRQGYLIVIRYNSISVLGHH